MAKPGEQQKARELRRQGGSIPAIGNHLGVARGSVSLWVRDVELTPEQIERLKANSHSKGNMEKARLTRLAREEARRDEERKEARALYEKFKSDPRFMAGLVGYWAEGAKSGSDEARIANTSPEFLRLMMDWLAHYGNVRKENFALTVYMHSDLGTSEEECRKFWERQLGVPVTHFRWKENKHKNFRRRRSYNGTAYLRVCCSKRLFILISEWLHCLQSEWCAPVAQMDRAEGF